MIRGRSEKRTDPACLEAEAKFAAEERGMVYFEGGPVGYAREDGLYLRDVIARIEREENDCQQA